MTVIYVVRGDVGEYGDHRTWPVKAFRDLASAETFAAHATAHVAAIVADDDFVDRVRFEELSADDFERLTTYDPHLAETVDGRHYGTERISYGVGVKGAAVYKIDEVELVDD